MSGYTVIDVETTGLSPERGDRIVELGVVYLSEDGHVQDKWCTLVNPGRDVGATRIHGITASEVASAPTFAQLAPYVLRAVAGRTIVAHNASFDLRFLAAEMERAGFDLDVLPLVGVCTMRWSGAYLEAPSRRLIDCCRSCGVELTDAHSAQADAMAAAGLLGHYLRSSRYEPPWEEVIVESQEYPWPAFTGEYPKVGMVARQDVLARAPDGWLGGIVSRMPRAADVRAESYLAVLEVALLDNVLAEHEKDQLVAVAQQTGLTRGEVIDIHADYLQQMAHVALDDHVVTDDERAEMEHVARLLGLETSDVTRALDSATEAIARGDVPSDLTTVGIQLEQGDRVVFTGDMVVERGEWETRARAAGLDPGGVTKQTKLVVAADPNSLSGKAAKARTYGVPIVTEDAFAQIMERFVA